MNARGFSLIEVMVAVLVLALGMLGVAAMQAVSLKNSQSSFERSQAVTETYSILDRMRANRPAAIIQEYNLGTWTCDAPTATTLATTDLAAWINSLKANLNETACGRIACSSASCTIEVQWNDKRGTAGAQSFQVKTVTVL